MKTEILLVRHAEPMKTKFITNELIPLSTSGEKKAEELSNQQIFFDVSLVISSNYTRAIDTAKYIVKKMIANLL